jgi:hypothetical protein
MTQEELAAYRDQKAGEVKRVAAHARTCNTQTLDARARYKHRRERSRRFIAVREGIKLTFAVTALVVGCLAASVFVMWCVSYVLSDIIAEGIRKAG